MNGRLRAFGLVALLMADLGWGAAAGAAEFVSVRASRGDDFGRIVFLWDRPVTHELTHDGRNLTVRFGRPMQASYQRVLGALRAYIDQVRPGADGRSVTFRLTGDFEAFGFDSGNSVILEVTQPKTPPPPSPPVEAKAETAIATPRAAAQAVAATDAPQVRVRIGVHPDYSRIVFDWPRRVDYKV
ncbi:MAG: hypothetical protein VW405_21445, partial [Rhodospirillaceae bacterium]